MSTVMIICPTHRDYREIAALEGTDKYRFLYHEYASDALEDLISDEPPTAVSIGDPEAEVESIVRRCLQENISAVVSTDDYPGTALAAIVAERLRLPRVSPVVNLLCQHKYYSRKIQQAASPESVPHFQLIDVRPGAGPPEMDFPVFVKPVKSCFSVGAQSVSSLNDLLAVKRRWVGLAGFFYPFDILLKKYVGLTLGTKFLLAETLLEGFQATLEGYVFQGRVCLLGIVDSVMFSNTIAFKRFEYPSSLAESVQERMFHVAKKVMEKMGFNNGMFSMEFIYNATFDTIHIVEINPRMSSQFADLFEKVDGTNSYSVLLNLAFSKKPAIKKGEGRYPVAASCVLRTLENKRVRKLPSKEEIERIQRQYPDMRIEVLATEGRRLSQQMQDGCSYRYGLINIGGGNRQEILEIFNHCRSNLTFVFEPADENVGIRSHLRRPAGAWSNKRRLRQGGIV